MGGQATAKKPIPKQRTESARKAAQARSCGKGSISGRALRLWCRKYLKAWTDGKPSSARSMENRLNKHILPRFCHLPLDSVDETAVQEFAADLKEPRFLGARRTVA